MSQHPVAGALLSLALAIPPVAGGPATITNDVPGSFEIFPSDVDGDGDTDLLSVAAAAHSVYWHENLEGDGSVWADHLITSSAIGVFSVFAADVDGDGDTDVLSASRFDEKVAWYENLGGGASSWVEHVVSLQADGASSVTADDIDGDGDLDVLSASQHDNKIAWYENIAGDGSTWATRVISLDAEFAVSVTSADLDGDGDQDVLSASFGDNKVSWYENVAADGSVWLERVITREADSVRRVVAADIDRDGDVDAISAAFGSNRIAWHENLDSRGESWITHTISTTGLGPVYLFVADLDQDMDLDVLAASQNDNRIAWFENLEPPGRAWAEHILTRSPIGAVSVAAADLDGDLDLDIVYSSIGNGSITWFDNDGSLKSRLRLSSARTDGHVELTLRYEIENASMSPFELGIYRSTDLTLDGGDELLDVVPVNLESHLEPGVHELVLTLGSEVALPGHGIAEIDADYRLLVVADHQNGDHDGGNVGIEGLYQGADGCIYVHGLDDDADFVMSVSSGPLGILANGEWFTYDATGIISLRVRLHSGINFLFGSNVSVPIYAWGGTGLDFLMGAVANDTLDGAGAGDRLFGGNGHDVLVGGPGNDLLSGGRGFDILIGGEGRDQCPGGEHLDTCDEGFELLGSHTMPPEFDIPRLVSDTENGAVSLASGDVNGDGRDDLVSAAFYGDTIIWHENRADGREWNHHTVAQDANGAHSVAISDIDRDGDLDVVSASEYDDKIAWYENDAGDGSSWLTHTVTTNARNATTVVTGDVDRDGRTDILSASFADDKIAWYRNLDGSGLDWQEHRISTRVDTATSVSTGDVDGDGDLDVLSASRGTHEVAWHENLDGAGMTWRAHTISNAALAAVSVVTNDVDGDGDLDVLSASRFDGEIDWYENLGGGTIWRARNINSEVDGVHEIFASDVDADGDTDVISAAWLPGEVAWHENSNGDGTAWLSRRLYELSGAASVHDGDFDGDGMRDVGVASVVEDTVLWFRNLGRGTGSVDIDDVVVEGERGMTVRYRVDTDAGVPFRLAVYRSSDGFVDSADEMLDTWLVDNPERLSEGIHELLLEVGVDVTLPGAGAAEPETDYRVLVRAESAAGEPLGRSSSLVGVYTSDSGVLFVHGTDAPDSDSLVAATVGSTTSLQLNGRRFSYETSSVSAVRVRPQGGTNIVHAVSLAVPIRVWGGSGIDVLFGGVFNDVLAGGDGEDVIFGGFGHDIIGAGGGNDYLSGGDGFDVLAGEGGTDLCVSGEAVFDCP